MVLKPKGFEIIALIKIRAIISKPFHFADIQKCDMFAIYHDSLLIVLVMIGAKIKIRGHRMMVGYATMNIQRLDHTFLTCERT